MRRGWASEQAAKQAHSAHATAYLAKQQAVVQLDVVTWLGAGVASIAVVGIDTREKREAKLQQ